MARGGWEAGGGLQDAQCLLGVVAMPVLLAAVVTMWFCRSKPQLLG